MNKRDDFEIETELLIEALMLKYHYDFRHYTRSSVRRRLAHALSSFGLDSVSKLQERLFKDAAFLPRLLDYLTVSTTEMFRDPDYFLALREKVVPYLRTFPSIKVWIAGCSTGQEVFSLAILLKEEGLLTKTLFYATDINPNSLEAARRGIYHVEEVQKASVNYQKSGGKNSLSDYYRAAYGSVQFDQSLVKACVFSDHSLATDNVFAEVHFVSCRNVLIYFDRSLQDRAVGLFKDSLVRRGFLGLGTKESMHFSAHRDAFEPVAREQKIFQKI